MVQGFFFSVAPAVAEDRWPPPDPDVTFAHFPSKLADDAPRLVSLENLPLFLAGGIATVYAWGAEDPQNRLAGDLKGLEADALFDFGHFYGEGWVEGGGGVLAWTVGGLTGDAKLAGFGRDAVGSLLVSTVLVSGIKVAVDRERPNGNGLGFPSGHTITAFCFAPVVEAYWGWEAALPAYLLASLTGLARIEGGHHYLSDVFAGATLGILVGRTVARPPEGFSFTAGPGTVGVGYSFD